MPEPTASPLEELTWRGLLHQYTEGLDEALASGATSIYVGFDPTAPSLHVGNLVPIMALVHLQQAGHRPVVLVGGGTGLIGDPSGKRTERQLLSPREVNANAMRIERQLQRFLRFSGPQGAQMRNNAVWLRRLGAIPFLRDVGKHFTVNYMLAKESVQSRLEGGISFTEFGYMLLQAVDFLELFRRDGVTVQGGGSDQWGNITAGIELIRRADGAAAHGFTVPLITTAAGTKFGKTEAGTVWLDPALTSPYRFFQFWINTDDRDVVRYLRMFTLFSREEIEALELEALTNPAGRRAQRALAMHLTERVHGPRSADLASSISKALFGGGTPQALTEDALAMLEGEIPFAKVRIRSGDALDAVELCVATGLTPSKGAARRLIEQRGLSVNGRRVAPEELEVYRGSFLRGRYILLRKGTRDYALVRATGLR
ncbi:MAG TPA: tyrosine--tRNA ligase [Gemmatimonadaceae bacterium]|nr:tyrosine--tRNA ligase [Gemmatimonadaceae bacterium]